MGWEERGHAEPLGQAAAAELSHMRSMHALVLLRIGLALPLMAC